VDIGVRVISESSIGSLISYNKDEICIDALKKKARGNKMFSNLSVFLTHNISLREKKNYGIFFTSQSLVKKIVYEIIRIQSRLNLRFKKILEPSFGSGEFLTVLSSIFENSEIVGLEYNYNVYNVVDMSVNKNKSMDLKNMDFLDFYDKNFDLIVGNPPYMSVRKQVYDSYSYLFSNKVNMYALFLVHALKKLNKRGLLVFIVPKNFFTLLSYNKIRVYIEENYTILDIVENNESSFLETRTETCVLFLQKERTQTKRFIVSYDKYVIFSPYFSFFRKRFFNGKSLKQQNFIVSVGRHVNSRDCEFLCATKNFLFRACDISNSNTIN